MLVDGVFSQRFRRVQNVFVEGFAASIVIAAVLARAVARNIANRHAIGRRNVAGAEDRIDEGVEVDVVTTRQLGARQDGAVFAVDVVALRIGIAVTRAGQVIAVANGQVFAKTPLGGQNHIAAVEVQAIGAGHFIGLATAFERRVVLCGHSRLIDGGQGDQVDHAGHGVRTVNRTCAVFQDFSTLQDGGRDHVQVERADLATGTGRTRAAAVQQHQRTLGAKATQRHGVDAGAAFDDEAAELVVELHRTGGHRAALDQFSRIHHALQGGGFSVDHLDRRRRGELVATQARTGDDNAVIAGFSLFFLLGGLLGFLCKNRCAAHGQRRNASQNGRAQQALFVSHAHDRSPSDLNPA